jgi:CheY-like chemotaxis protein
LSILIVDDMKSMRLTIRKMLQTLNIGKTLKFAENGKDGLEVLATTRCDLAIIDWNMPVMNGVDMLDRIRADKFLRDIAVIMVTAESERDIVSEVAETEVNAYLLKPLTLAALDSKIKGVIKRINKPNPATLHRLKARELEEIGEYESAIEQIRLALRYNPSASRLLRELGLLHFKINKNTIAEKCLLKAVSVNNQDAVTRAHLADYYIKTNQLDKAGKYYLQILSLSVKYHDQAMDLAEKLLNRGSKQLSITIFSKVITLAKKQNVVREQVIDICLQNGETDYPRRLLEESIRENPSNYDMVFKVGLIYQESGDWEKAMNYFVNVDRHVRGHIEAKFQLAKIYYMNRKILKADDYLNQILRIDPKNKEALELRREI